MDIILIVLLTCGFPDTIIVKNPDEDFARGFIAKEVDKKAFAELLSKKPITIVYSDPRQVCA